MKYHNASLKPGPLIWDYNKNLFRKVWLFSGKFLLQVLLNEVFLLSLKKKNDLERVLKSSLINLIKCDL